MPHPIDIHVGARLRLRRKQLGLSQAWLASQLEVSFQQIQKYERGTNRISASVLYHLAELLTVPLAYFFPEPPQTDTDIARLVRCYEAIPDFALRQQTLTFLHSLALAMQKGVVV